MISRVKHKEEAKRIMATRQNKSGMIGVNVLARVLNVALYCIVAAPLVLIMTGISYGFGAIFGSLLGVGTISIYSLSYGYLRYISYLASAGMVFILILVAILFLIISGAMSLVSEIVKVAIKGPVTTGKNRFYLYLKKTNRRASTVSLFEGFDYFLNLAMVYATQTFRIFLWPMICFIGITVLAVIIIAIGGASGSVGGVIFGIVVVVIGFIAFCVLWIYLKYEMWAVSWIVADHPQSTSDQAIEQSKRLCKGHIWDLIVLDITFWGWNILSVITGGLVGLLYSEPYKNMTYALVYAELKGSATSLDGIEGPIDRTTGLSLTIRDFPPSPPLPPTPSPSVLGVTGMYAGNTFPMDPDKELIIGRDSAVAGIVISSGGEKVSRRHCAVRFNSRNNNYEVVDFSSNGVYVGGHRITPNAPVQLPRGTQIELGNKNNTFRLV